MQGNRSLSVVFVNPIAINVQNIVLSAKDVISIKVTLGTHDSPPRVVCDSNKFFTFDKEEIVIKQSKKKSLRLLYEKGKDLQQTWISKV